MIKLTWSFILSAACFVYAADRPNIVFLFTDDQSVESVGCYGNTEVLTPNMDSIAKDGMMFDNHYNTTAICMASRANVMTGKLEYKNGCNFDHGHLHQSLWNDAYPMLLRKAGYRTAIAGKVGFEIATDEGKKIGLPANDFDGWGGGPGQTHYQTAKNPSIAHYANEFPHSSRAYGAFGRDFIAESAQEKKPFCLSISFKAPHQPTTPDPAFDHIYAGKKFTRPANYGREYGEHFSPQSKTGRQYERFFSWNYADKYDEVMATYYQQIYGVDVAVGMIRKALSEHGVADNTVIIFTSDNGFFNGSHGYGSKVLPYEESARAPLMIHDPRHPNKGKQLRIPALTGNIDIAPTILDLAGLPIPQAMDGKSLLPLLDDPKAAGHDSLPLINVWGPISAQSLGVVTRDWKYIYWPYADKDFVPSEELYNTAEDPLELKNLLAEAPPELAIMRKIYRARLDHWKEHAVAWNTYQPYATWFDPDVEWAVKAPLLKKSAPAKPNPKRKPKQPAS